MQFIDINSQRDFDSFEKLYQRLKNGEVADGTEAVVQGCIHRIRLMSDFSFVILRTARRLFQCVYIPTAAEFAIDAIKEGDFVEVTGILKVEERSRIGYDFHLKKVKVLSSPAEELPFVLNKKNIELALDNMLDYRPISLRHPNERAIVRICDGIMQGFRKFFQKENFVEFVAPKMVSAGAEGGSDMFEVKYFEKHAYLAQSPQIYKQMMVGVFEKVCVFGPVFRAEKSHTSRHITEFQGIDLEMGFIQSYEDIMLAEARALKTVFETLRTEYADELALLNVKVPDFDTIPMISFSDVKELISKKYKRPFRSEDDFEPDEEKLIGDYFKKEYGSSLVFVTKYPSKKRPFYAMDDPEDPRFTLSFDLLLNGSEITTGGQRIHKYDEQIQKMQNRGMDIAAFDDYLMIHKFGMPPHGGLGIGLERFAMKLLNLDNIRYATVFPRDVDRLKP